MEQYIRLASAKMLYLSSACADSVGKRCELYQCGDVMALVSDPLGHYHLCRKSAQCRGLNLCSEELVNYLIEKYGVQVNSRLTAWTGVEGERAALFFAAKVSKHEAGVSFGENFKRVELTYRKRYGQWVFVEDKCISFTAEIRAMLPGRLTLRGDGTRLALVGDPSGEFALSEEGRKGACILSAALAHYCRREFGGSGRSVLFHARAVRGGICFALREEELLPEDGVCAMPLIRLNVAPDYFLTMHGKNQMYVSAQSGQALGKATNLYRAGNWLAFRSESGGGELNILSCGYQRSICSVRLTEAVKGLYPGARKLFLYRQGPFWVLVRRANELGKLPPPTEFKRVYLKEEMPWSTGMGGEQEQYSFTNESRVVS